MTPPPPSQAGAAPPSRAHLVRGPLLIGAAGASAMLALHLRDPHTSGSWGVCPFLLLTGQPCPGCGGLRAMNDLTHGDISGALGSNAMAVAFVVFMGVAWVVWIARRWRGENVPWVRLPKAWLIVIGAAVIVFAVFRWTPWGAALRP
ncbi:MAG: DUF2752 domain-containing protein [Aeromicrobium sp.]|uniref:DUF2752 domain-containing protein n=1 Tax=Aeromicrobium sp. TaxID=1871063 RepID=UPI0039E24C07